MAWAALQGRTVINHGTSWKNLYHDPPGTKRTCTTGPGHTRGLDSIVLDDILSSAIKLDVLTL